MDKGIRPWCNNRFVELNEQRRRGEMSNTLFRKSVMSDVMTEFGCTLAAAATHYNHAFKNLKELNAELVSGLGRPEDKKGGRKKKVPVVATPTEILPIEFIDQQYQDAVAAAAGAIGPMEVPDQVPNTADVTEAQPEVTYSVRKVSDGTVVCEGLTLEAANNLIAKAAAAKKAKLELVQ